MKQILQYSIDGFKGVDLTSPDVLVNSCRASYMRNFLLKDGALEKRSGWRELYRFEGKRINGIFLFDDGSVRRTLIHAGTGLYRLEALSDGSYGCTDLTRSSSIGACEVMGLRDNRSQAFQNNGRLFIVGAGPLMAYGKWADGGYELRMVKGCGEEYVPTTTININDSSVENDIRATLDDVNMLTPKRINRLVGEMEGGSNSWMLDGSVDSGTIVKVHLESWLWHEGECSYSERYLLTDQRIDDPLESGHEVWRLIDERSGTEVFEAGYVDYTTGELVLSCNCCPYAPGRDNITVEFEHTPEAYNKDYLNKVFTGARYGTDGGSDRLFLAVEGTNLEIFSEPDNFFYFGDRNTVLVGNDRSAITAFARLDDHTLAIFKEEDEQDAPIYYQTGYYETLYDDAGNISKMTAFFPVQAGSSGEACLSASTLGNLAGDLLMLSRNGVFGVHLTDNVSTSQRYTKERGKYIAGDLKKRTLTDACAAVYDGRYYLALGDEEGLCYVADGRYTCYPAHTVEKSFQYEWTVLAGIPARVFFVLEGALYFGTASGSICLFDGGNTDRLLDEEKEIYGEWQSASLDFGSDERGKTLMKMTVSYDADELSFGYQTRNLLIKSIRSENFSFWKLNLLRLSFAGNYRESYSVKVKEKDFNYMKFGIYSEKGTCAVYKFKAFYKINSRNKGVR